jgi:hypothetical protein
VWILTVAGGGGSNVTCRLLGDGGAAAGAAGVACVPTGAAVCNATLVMAGVGMHVVEVFAAGDAVRARLDGNLLIR